MPSPFLDALARRTLVFDGAMGTSIFNKNLSVHDDYCGCENYTDILVRTRPDVIQEIHESFLAVGADAVETDFFGANKLVLAEFGLEGETEKTQGLQSLGSVPDRLRSLLGAPGGPTFALNKMAAEVARAAFERFATKERPRFVVGSMGPGTKLLTLGNTDWDAMFASYREQARGLIAGGAGRWWRRSGVWAATATLRVGGVGRPLMGKGTAWERGVKAGARKGRFFAHKCGHFGGVDRFGAQGSGRRGRDVPAWPQGGLDTGTGRAKNGGRSGRRRGRWRGALRASGRLRERVAMGGMERGAGEGMGESKQPARGG